MKRLLLTLVLAATSCSDEGTSNLAHGMKDIMFEKSITSDWGAGYCVEIRMTNVGREARKWSYSLEQFHDVLDKFWNSQIIKKNHKIIFTGVEWNQLVLPNQTIDMGYCVSRNQEHPKPPVGLEKLPFLGVNESVSKAKIWVRNVYDIFPQFSEIYEGRLGLTKDEALAFHYGVMSRESGKDNYWQMTLETGWGGPGHAYGPFQAAVTNFIGGGYDKEILDLTGLPKLYIKDFRDPKISAFAGMKRLAEGVLQAYAELGSSLNKEDYLLASMAHHNEGHVSVYKDVDWQIYYGNEVLRLARAYLRNHLYDDKAFWTGEPIKNL